MNGGGGLGPAACWLAHKRLESWSRIAKERVGAVRKSSEKSEDDKSDSTPPPLNSSTTNSISSSIEVIFSFLLYNENGWWQKKLYIFLIKNICCYLFFRNVTCFASPLMCSHNHWCQPILLTRKICVARWKHRPVLFTRTCSIRANRFRHACNGPHPSLVKVA